ncbi:MAG: hypothetical protein H7332_18450 [Bdellovibrionales bacterium]|nr:hypothetical protein [Ramlibacter sp.]
MKLGFLVFSLALFMAGCGGGGGSPGATTGSSGTNIGAGGSATTSQQVLDLVLRSSTSGADLSAVPAGTNADFLVVGSTTTNGSTTLSVSGVSGNCNTATLCQRTDGFPSVSTVALSSTAAVSLISGSPIRLTVPSSVVPGSTLTLTVTETTGRQVTRSFLTS